MIRIELGAEALGQLRVAVSPLWELVASLQLLGPGRPVPWPYSKWAESTRRRLAGRPGGELVRCLRELPGSVPAFLTPLPVAPMRTIDEELEDLRHTPTELVRAQLADLVVADGPDAGRDPNTRLDWVRAVLEGER
ncbi:hypothetical protein [Micromonospora marina]|uniref:hypothetical protein n=1 Tax=Micromonospora marina TaxID=307120 RepID=UPI003D7371EC